MERKQHSVYYEMNSEQAYKRFNGLEILATVLYMLAGVGLIVWILLKGEVILPLLIMIVLRFSIRWVSARLEKGLQEILLKDCDPVKLLEIYNHLEQKRSKMKRNSMYLAMKAQCCFYRKENWEEGARYLQAIQFKKKTTMHELIRVNLYCTYYSISRQWDGMCQIKQEIDAMQGQLKMNGFQKKIFKRIQDDCESKLLIHDEKFPEARAVVLDLLKENGNLMLNQVILRLRLAKVEKGLGEEQKARECLQFVVEHGNTLSAVDEAKEMLEEIDRQ